MKYLLISVGCLECGEATEIGSIVTEDEIPKDYRIVQLNSDARVRYSSYELAVALEETK